MRRTRKTTYDERIAIVQRCLKSNKDYRRIAQEYGCSYQQVRNWVIRYEKDGPSGLEDRRGRRSGSMPGRSSDEDMRYRIAVLEKENAHLRMELELLKKICELENQHIHDYKI